MVYNLFSSMADPVVKERIFVTIPESLLIALVGMVIIFAVLAVLTLILIGFKQIFKIKWLRDDYVKPVKNENLQLDEVVSTEDDEQEIAAVMAALMCFYDTEKSETNTVAPFRIRNIKRIK